MGVVSTPASEVRPASFPMASASSGAVPIARAARAAGTCGRRACTTDAGSSHTARGQLAGQRFRSAVQRRRPLAVFLLQPRRRFRRRRPVSRRDPGRRSIRPAETSRRRQQSRRRMGADAERDGKLCCSPERLRRRRPHDLLSRVEWPRLVEPRRSPASTARRRVRRGLARHGRAIVFARSSDVANDPIRLFVAQCNGATYGEAQAGGFRSIARRLHAGTRGRCRQPRELLVSGSAKAPKAGKMDIYRTLAPTVTGTMGCR